MKIAIFTDCYLDLIGGIVSVINAEKAELERRGHTVYVFSSGFPRSKIERQALAKKHIFPVPSCRVFGRGLTPIARRPRIIEQWLAKTHPEILDFDVFYVHYEAGCSIAGIRLGHAHGIPVVQAMHGREDVGEEKLVPLGLRTFVATMLNWFHSWYLPHKITVHRDNYLATTFARAKMWTLMANHANAADLVIFPSAHFRQKMLRYGIQTDSIFLHHGVPDRLLSSPEAPRVFSPGEPLKIIWHSRLSGEKRILEFLEAVKIAIKNIGHNQSFSLVLYGDGPDAAVAKRYVSRHHLPVEFRGTANFDAIWREMAHAHLDVLVSSGYDTFGMTLVEAEAAGLPVFIADPDMQEIVPASSFVLSKDESPAAMADALMSLVKHPEKIATMSAKMLADRDQKRDSLKVDMLEKVFHNLISRSSKKS